MNSARSTIRPGDLVATATSGLRTRPGRTLLTALGIAIGIASMVAVLGISASSKADLLAELDELGTNLLQVQPGENVFGDAAKLPKDSQAMIDRIGTVTDSAAVTKINSAVGRNRFDDVPNGLDVLAVDQDLTSTLGLQARAGRLFEGQTSTLPVAVLGSVAAERLGISSLDGGPTITVGGRPVQVIGIAEPLPLNPDVDRSVLIGNGYARKLGVQPNPTAIFVRVDPSNVERTRPVLARTANPTAPNEVQVSRPSDALEAQAKVDENLQRLLLALGAVALLVGGVGIANVMVIAVLERRGEIGVRRAIGATRGHIRAQFVIEASALAALGGAVGTGLGIAVTWTYASYQGWRVDIPAAAAAGGIALALVIGAFAGLYPAGKAARLDPAEAVRPAG